MRPVPRKQRTIPLLTALGVMAALSWGVNLHAKSELPTEWPLVVERDNITNTIYQPQLEAWDYSTWKGRCAVAVQPRGAPQPTFGTVELQARTRVDRSQREVWFEQIQLVKADFPSAGAEGEGFAATLRSLLPKELRSIALDRVEASLAILQAGRKAAGQPLGNEAPVLLFSPTPAMLVLVDGPAVYRRVDGTALDRVLNTRALILRDQTGRHFLHLFDGYVEAPGLAGPWTVAKKVSADLKKAEKQAVANKQVDLLAGQEDPLTRKQPALKTTPVPKLYVAIVPTELIVTVGEPKWAPIPGTQLLYVTNTTAHVFKELQGQDTYVLISGRWFRSSSFSGPWEYVPGGDLPKDFANIPDDSPAENVKASVPGTRQAQEAAIANSIPHTSKVDRLKAKMDPPPTYDGSPQLKPIAGTPLHYVGNCPTAVIQVDAKSWYACQNGVWFVATGANGPWIVATSVPAVIYSIPPQSPMHYVVYSRIYHHDLDYVWVGTTPGFYGTVVGPDGLVVYGTGYVYPAYVGSTVYVSYSVTYGYGSNPCWTPWAGWAFGFAVGWAMADDWYWWCGIPPAPYWGPYWYPCYGAYYNAYGGITAWGPYGWAGTTGYIYTQNGPWTGVSRAAAGYNAWTGNQWATRYGRAYNSTTGTRVIGQRGAVENVYTGNYAYGGRGAFYNENTGIAGAGRKVTWGNEATGNQGTAGRATVYNPKTGEATHISGAKGEDGGVLNVNGHVIAGHDGNYYRPDGEGGWEQITKPPTGSHQPGTGGAGQRQDLSGTRPAQTQDLRGATPTRWDRVQPSAGPQPRIESLDREFQAQQRGFQRQQSFQAHRPSFGGRRR